jgi:site-specific recombinase XerD
MKLNKRASANAIIKAIMNNANGINTSKIKAKSKSDLIGQHGQKVSIKNHSIKSQQNFRSVLKQYIDFIKNNYGGKVLKHINNDTMLQFIAYKTNKVQGNTINTYISALGKISDNLIDLGINSTDRETITDYRTILKNHNIELHTQNVNRSYERPIELVNYLRDHTLFGLTASLQYFSGLRLDDATNFSKLAINQDNTLKVTGSKGGINYTTKALPKWLINELQQAKEQNIHIDKDEYRKALIESSNGTNQNYTGTHGLRYNFANERVRELQNNHLPKNEAMLKTSLEMGHSRISIISNHYYFT